MAELDAAATVAVLVGNRRARLAAECRELVLAAHWAVLYPPEVTPTILDYAARKGWEPGLLVGGVGTPRVGEFAADGLGPLLRTSTGGALRLLGDALDLRHRLPRLWQLVLASEVAAGKARRVAAATRHLSMAAAAAVDAAVAGVVESLPWGRFLDVLEVRVMEAGPTEAEREARLDEPAGLCGPAATTGTG